MSLLTPNPLTFSNLVGKVVVLTGGASGIGASTIRILHHIGAHIIFGDLPSSPGAALASELSNTPTRPPHTASSGSITFIPTDCTSHTSTYALFHTAYTTHGRVDHAIAFAGILERGNWFDAALTIESVATPATTSVLNVDLHGVCIFARIAVVFLRSRGKEEGREKGDKSLMLIGSVASFRDSPGLWMYQVAKHGVLGLLRALRGTVFERDGVRVNCVCPAMTLSPMTAAIAGKWVERGAPVQSAEEVAGVVVGAMAETRMVGRNGKEEVMNGKAFYVEQGRGWEFEEGLRDSMDVWLGQEPAGILRGTGKRATVGGLL